MCKGVVNTAGVWGVLDVLDYFYAVNTAIKCPDYCVLGQAPVLSFKGWCHFSLSEAAGCTNLSQPASLWVLSQVLPLLLERQTRALQPGDFWYDIPVKSSRGLCPEL